MKKSNGQKIKSKIKNEKVILDKIHSLLFHASAMF